MGQKLQESSAEGHLYADRTCKRSGSACRRAVVPPGAARLLPPSLCREDASLDAIKQQIYPLRDSCSCARDLLSATMCQENK